MMQRIADRYKRLNGEKLIALGVIVGLVLVGTLSLRAYQANRADKKICSKVDRLDKTLIALVEGAQKTLPTIRYYHDHPDELARALADNRTQVAALRAAACDPSNITSP